MSWASEERPERRDRNAIAPTSKDAPARSFCFEICTLNLVCNIPSKKREVKVVLEGSYGHKIFWLDWPKSLFRLVWYSQFSDGAVFLLLQQLMAASVGKVG